MTRTLRWMALGLVLVEAAPAFAQMSFEGLDSTDKKKKKKKKKGDKDKTTTDKDTADAPADTGKAAAPAKTDEAPLPAGGLDLTAPPAAADTGKKVPPPPGSAKPDKAAPAMSFGELDVSGKSADRQRIDAVAKLFAAESYEQAALGAQEILDDPKAAALQVEARYLLAKSLYRMGMYHSALGQFSRLLELGDRTKFFKSSLEWLFFISHKTTNEQVILDEIAKYSNFDFPEKFKNEFHYLLARYYFVRGKALDQVDQKAEADKAFDQVKRLVLLVPRNDAFYARTKFLEGLAYFREDNFQTALEAMKEVVRLTKPSADKSGTQNKLDQELRELAWMQLARTHYGHQQNRYAVAYYDKVERGGLQWLEALFESSWASYRIGQYERALGNLITLSSPFFRDDYFPEAYILKAVIYYENCRYRESNLILKDFSGTYEPVQQELEQMLGKDMDSSEYYNVLSDIQKRNLEAGTDRNAKDVILERVLKLALTDRDLKKTNDSILELEAELDSVGAKADTFKYSNLAKTLMEDLKKQRQEMVKRAGLMAKGKLKTELDALKDLLAKGLRIKFETETKEKEFLENSLQNEGEKEVVVPYKYTTAVADDQLYWPYEGEYWRDELGTYRYTLTKGCSERGANRHRNDETGQ
jgi:tetratricopeptide (TPR) repeat protein